MQHKQGTSQEETAWVSVTKQSSSPDVVEGESTQLSSQGYVDPEG